MKLRPKGGWRSFSRGKELIDTVFSPAQECGWNYMGLTSNTMVVEEPKSGSTIYLEIDADSVFDMVVSQGPNAGPEFMRFVEAIIRDFTLTETE